VKFSRIYFGSCQPSGRRGIPSGRSSVNNIRPDAHQCLEVSNSLRLHLSERNGKSSGRSSEFEKIQCSSASVRTTWLYRPDAIQCLTRNRVSASRHSYGKMAATVRTMCDPVWTMSSIRQERAYQVQPSGRCVILSGRPSVYCSIRPDDVSFRLDIRQTSIICPDDVLLPSGHLHRIEKLLCQLSPSGRFSSMSGHLLVLERFTDSFQVLRKERSINRPDDVVSRPDAYLRKARIAVQNE
jgi:hypothetical protein